MHATRNATIDAEFARLYTNAKCEAFFPVPRPNYSDFICLVFPRENRHNVRKNVTALKMFALIIFAPGFALVCFELRLRSLSCVMYLV